MTELGVRVRIGINRTLLMLVVAISTCAVAISTCAIGGCNEKRRSRFAEDHRDYSNKQTTTSNQSSKSGKETAPVPDPSSKLHKFAMHSTVRLIVEPEKPQDGTGFGSGVVVGKDDKAVFVLTVWHAAKPGIRHVEFFSSTSTLPVHRCSLPEVISKSERRDLALLRIPVDGQLKFQVAKIAPLGLDPDYGYSVGCSSGRTPTLLGEQILGHDTIHPAGSDKIRAKMWFTDNPQVQGRSGGALLDKNGNLLGIALMATEHPPRGYYCHTDEIREYLASGSFVTN